MEGAVIPSTCFCHILTSIQSIQGNKEKGKGFIRVTHCYCSSCWISNGMTWLSDIFFTPSWVLFKSRSHCHHHLSVFLLRLVYNVVFSVLFRFRHYLTSRYPINLFTKDLALRVPIPTSWYRAQVCVIRRLLIKRYLETRGSVTFVPLEFLGSSCG